VPELEFFSFLGQSLDAIAHEATDAYCEMCAAMGSRTVQLIVDREPMHLSATRGRHALCRGCALCAVELRLERPTIVRLLEGRCTLVEVALRGDLILKGAADDLIALYGVLMAFVQGAVRSTSTPKFLDRYLITHSRRPPRAEERANDAGRQDDEPERTSPW
jgi:hypothetical protein